MNALSLILLLFLHQSAPHVQPPTAGSSLSVYPNRFPASRTCRESAVNAGNCNENRFATFTLTWVLGPGESIRRGELVKTTFAYQYNGTYRTAPRYTRGVRWPRLQNSDPAGANYVTVKVATTGSIVEVRVDIDDEGDPEILFNNPVGEGDVITVTYGDTSGRGPGCHIPPVAYDVDLVVLRASERDRVFEAVAQDMPTLSVVGAELDRFWVVAPSTPADATFEIIVTAMQGEDERLLNSYMVPGYTGTIEFSSTDPGAVLPTPYQFQPEDKGVRRFAVTLSDGGTHTITVREQGSSRSGTSNPVAVGRTFGTEGKQLYWGLLHQHTNIGGHASQTPQYAYEYAKSVSGLDFLSLSEHCSPELEWDYNTRVADEYHEPGRFVTFYGIEWSRPDFGHRHLVYRDAGTTAGHCGCLFAENPTIPCYRTLSSLLGSVQGTDVLVIPHHMAWNFLGQPYEHDAVLGDINNTNQRLYEIFSSHGDNEKFDNAPYFIHKNQNYQWGPEKAVYFQDAIALGYRFGITAGSDNHTGKPGSNISGKGVYSRQGLTAVLAGDLSRNAIWEALEERSTYGTTGARMILDFSVGGALMGGEIVSGEFPEVKVHATGTDTISTVTVIRNGYDTVYECHPDAADVDITFVDTGVEERNTYSYYVRVVQTDQHKAWSSPVWIEYLPGKPFDIASVYPNPFNPGMVVRFSLPEKTRVKAEIFTVDGKRVAVLADSDFPAGVSELPWDGNTAYGSPAACGVYFVRLNSSYGTVVRKAVLLR